MRRAARPLDGLSLGEEVARSLGINMVRLRLQISIGLALAVGAVVSVTGVIGFVGLLAPHLVRPLTGALPSKTLLPAALLGAILLVLADSLIRAIPTPTELKLGVVTAFLGVPLLLALLTRPGASLLNEQ